MFTYAGAIALLLLCASAAPPVEAPKPRAGDVPSWAADYLADPLAAKATVTEADLRAALAAPESRDAVIERHFRRAEMTPERQQAFLRDALSSESPAVRVQAARELSRLGMLGGLIRERLKAAADDPRRRDEALAGLRWLGPPESEGALRAAVQGLASPDARVREAAIDLVSAAGADAVPMLLDALGDRRPVVRVGAADALGRIAASEWGMPGDVGAPAPVPSPPGEEAPPTVAKGGTAPGARVRPRVVEPAPKVVRVYFGTNREMLAGEEARRFWWVAPLVAAGCLAALLALLIRAARGPEVDPARRSRLYRRAAVVGVLGFGALAWLVGLGNSVVQARTAERQGPAFGSHRDPGGTLRYGFCDVLIPPTHELGQVERPVLGPEDEMRHVVLKRVQLAEEEAFFEAVRASVGEAGGRPGACFVFIHGYNVSFDEAARRTSQIHVDLKIRAAPLFYSWPSRGDVTSYLADRNEVEASKDYVRRFLLGVAERSGAEKVHVIAHSMGGAIVSAAIEEIDPERRLFDQIVLAAPDVDAEVFRRRILPRLEQVGARTTLYCSRGDWALHASRFFNDAPRAGDSSERVFVAGGLDTVDASDTDTDLLGHTYYGDCLPILADVRALFEKNPPPPARGLLEHFATDDPPLPYWAFPE